MKKGECQSRPCLFYDKNNFVLFFTVALLHVLEVHAVDGVVGHNQHQLVIADGHVADAVRKLDVHLVLLEDRILGHVLVHRNVAGRLDAAHHHRVRVGRLHLARLRVELVQKGGHGAGGG